MDIKEYNNNNNKQNTNAMVQLFTNTNISSKAMWNQLTPLPLASGASAGGVDGGQCCRILSTKAKWLKKN
jgi:hypothetical protein